MKRTILIAALAATPIGFGGGFAVGHYEGKKQRPCHECCSEGEMCMDEEEWVVASIGQVDDQGAAAEMSRLLDVCWAKRDAKIADMPVKMSLGLELAKCKGALEECRRD